MRDPASERDIVKVLRALISVSDKTGLEDLVKGLHVLGVEIMSTGGTAKEISSFGVPVQEVSSYTGFPEMLDGRLKTLHPKIHGGLLARRDNDEHMRQIRDKGIYPIDMAVVNLYPFEKTVSRKGVGEEEAIENIDIGGPTMIRSAAKNFRSVAVITSPSQYSEVLEEMKSNFGELSDVTLKGLAAAAFALTSCYDSVITGYLSSGGADGGTSENGLPDIIGLELRKIKALRYGENPHQKAAFYRDAGDPPSGISAAEQMQGKELSFNNILDLSSAFDMVKEFEMPAVSIVKHNNPCGLATAEDLQKAYMGAIDCDRMSAFGGVLGFNGPITGATARMILDEAGFIECIIAPGYDDAALDIFKSKKNLRILRTSFTGDPVIPEMDFKKVSGGVLVQDKDSSDALPDQIKKVTEKEISPELNKSLIFAWKAVKYVKSNAIVLCKDTRTVGIGAGQMSRVDSVMLAVRKAGDRANGSVLASDAFFPKPDSIEVAHKAGIAAIIQPGGSIKDQEVIDACNDLGIPMVFTGMRHFRH